MLSYAIGVDLGGTNLRIAAVDESGKLLEKLSSGTDLARGRDFVIDEMTQAIRQLLDNFRGRGESRGVGIGVPGIIDMDTGMLRESPNLPGWSEFPVHAEIERRLGIPVMLENDANAAALGEKWLGAAKDYEQHVHAHARHRRRRRHCAGWKDLARHERHGRRIGPHQC